MKTFLIVLFGLAIATIQVAVAAESGIASWYGPGFEGHRTASGTVFHSSGNTCAHRSYPFGTVLRVINLANHRSATCVVRDRGPFVRGRVLDLSRYSAHQLGLTLGRVRIEVVP